MGAFEIEPLACLLKMRNAGERGDENAEASVKQVNSKSREHRGFVLRGWRRSCSTALDRVY